MVAVAQKKSACLWSRMERERYPSATQRVYMNTNNLKLAIQKDGRLTEDTLGFLRASGLEFESYKRKLFSTCRNLPIEILYVRDDDIPRFVENGTADLGILGQNMLNEERPTVKKLLNLRYGYCTLALSVPKESPITKIEDLRDKTIATSYPRSTKQFFGKYGVEVKTVTIRGSVEIAPSLNIADAVVDLISTGSTLAMNDLRLLCTIYRSEAVLIANTRSVTDERKSITLKQATSRFTSVLSAKNYKYIRLTLPDKSLSRFKKNFPSFAPANPRADDRVVATGIMKEDMFWGMLNRMKKLGAKNIYILPVEKIIS